MQGVVIEDRRQTDMEGVEDCSPVSSAPCCSGRNRLKD